jgi:cell division protein FtsQ
VNARTTIRKILFITIWVVIGGGTLTLLLAAIGKKNKERCSDYKITIKGVQQNFFVDEEDVRSILMKESGGQIREKLLSSFNLHKLELTLEKNTWIKDAELYFDNNDVLHVTILEREPIARVFTTGGKSFYLDNTARKMPLADKLSAKVPVFTGFPDKKVLVKKDSILLNDVIKTAEFIFNDPFWMSQVAQIDITPSRNLEMIPVIGDHVVRLGNGDQIEKKFQRLFVFYKQVMSKTGFNRYKNIDVQYSGQVIALKGDMNKKVDSVQLRKNVEKLLQQSGEIQFDTIINEPKHIKKPSIKIDQVTAPKTDLKKAASKSSASPDDPNVMKTTSRPSDEMKVPKAVMPKRQM